MEKIVIIDDSIKVASRLKILLESTGFHVHISASSTRGLELIREVKPDLVITEIVMPEKDGFEIISEVRKQFPSTKIIPMVSGSLSNAGMYLQAMRSLGIELALKKPFRDKYLVSTINVALNRKNRTEDIT